MYYKPRQKSPCLREFISNNVICFLIFLACQYAEDKTKGPNHGP